MGRQPLPRPRRLAEKLTHLRAALRLSQNELIRRMGLEDFLLREEVSDFERGKRVPRCRCYSNTHVSPASIWTRWLMTIWICLPSYPRCQNILPLANKYYFRYLGFFSYNSPAFDLPTRTRFIAANLYFI
jgi:hypothetical protein